MDKVDHREWVVRFMFHAPFKVSVGWSIQPTAREALHSPAADGTQPTMSALIIEHVQSQTAGHPETKSTGTRETGVKIVSLGKEITHVQSDTVALFETPETASAEDHPRTR